MLDFKKLNIIKDNIQDYYSAEMIDYYCEKLNISVPIEVKEIIRHYENNLKEITAYMVSTLPKPFLTFVEENHIKFISPEINNSIYKPYIRLQLIFYHNRKAKSIYWDKEGNPSVMTREWVNIPDDGFKKRSGFKEPIEYYYFDK